MSVSASVAPALPSPFTSRPTSAPSRPLARRMSRPFQPCRADLAFLSLRPACPLSGPGGESLRCGTPRLSSPGVRPRSRVRAAGIVCC
jgi:hypothetical protein